MPSKTESCERVSLTGSDSLESDSKLVQAVASGDTQARQALVIRLWRRVRNTAHYFGRTRDEGEEMAQEAILQILQSAGGFRGEGCLEAWADVIALRAILRRIGKRSRLRLEVLQEEHEPASDAGDGPEGWLQQKAVRARVGALLAQLEPDRQMSLVLKLVAGYSVKEVADLVGRSVEAVRYEIRQGRLELRRLVLEDRELREHLPGRST
jgi:RNA polymerase sigma-70 factor, ECF subfamily